MTEDAIIRKILKFVRQVDGGDTDERVRQSAMERRWIDAKGVPTRDGERLAHSIDLMNQLGKPRHEMH